MDVWTSSQEGTFLHRSPMNVGDARVERARRRPRADDEDSGCSKALAQPGTTHSGVKASVTKLATLASSEHGDGPSEPTTKAAAAATHLQPGTADSGRNASVTKLAALA